MTNLYTLTKQIQELIPQINQKFGLNIEVESDYKIYRNANEFDGTDRLYHISEFPEDLEDDLLYLGISQIRQILFGLREVLGESFFDWDKIRHISKGYTSYAFNKEEELQFADGYANGQFSLTPKTQAEALCQRWLDGLEPMFDREPETVLTELVEVLENLLK